MSPASTSSTASSNNTSSDAPRLLADHPALDLLNTLERALDAPVDRWQTDEDVWQWLERVSLLPNGEMPEHRPQGLLAAATALRARDEQGPALCFQLLLVPCMDSRSDTPSMHEIEDNRTWRRSANLAAWQMYAGPGFLGELPPYAAPGRARDLSGLPPAYVEVAEIDPLRDEAIDYASRLMRAGVRTELHVYPGAYHASTYYQPQAGVSRRAAQDTVQALKRALG